MPVMADEIEMWWYPDVRSNNGEAKASRQVQGVVALSSRVVNLALERHVRCVRRVVLPSGREK